MKKTLILILSIAFLIAAIISSCSKTTPGVPEAPTATFTAQDTLTETVTGTATATFTVTETSTVTSTPSVSPTCTSTQVCGVKFGSNSDTTNGSTGTGSLFGYKYTAAADTVITSLSLKLQSASRYCIGLYSDNAGMPGNLLSWTGIKPVAAAGWATSGLLSECTVLSGTDLWIVFETETGGALAATDASSTYFQRYVYGVTDFAVIEAAGTMPDGGTWSSTAGYRSLLYATGCSY